MVDLRTLARHCHGPEPSSFVLWAIEIEEKSKCSLGSSREKIPFFFFFDKCFSFAEMTTKFNQELYAKMRAGNEPLSNLEKRVVQVIEKGTLVTPVAFVPEAIRVVSPATSVEEITPCLKRQRVVNKDKEKANSCSSSVWDDASLALTRA